MLTDDTKGERELICGYCNRLLRVDLTHGRCAVAALPDETILRQYVGGVGLGMKLLLDETRPGQRATDPDSPFIMLAGPLAGTSAPSSSELAVITLDFDRPYVAAAGHSSGYWAAYLKHAGYDGVVVTGKAKKPVFLWIDDEQVTIRDATAFWGLDTRETERLIKRSLHDQSDISVACIGPAGEAMLPGASMRNDRNYGVHNGGVGAVMGAKRLKALAVRGSRTVPLRSRRKFDKVTMAWSDALRTDSTSGSTAQSQAGILSSAVSHEEATARISKRIAEDAWTKSFSKRLIEAANNSWTVVPKKSYNSASACAYDFHINDGEFAGYTASVCGNAKKLRIAATAVGIKDPSEAIVLTDYFASIGLSPAVGGVLLGKAFAACTGDISPIDQTDGIERTPDNFDSARELLDQLIESRGEEGRALLKTLRDSARFLAPVAHACMGDACSGDSAELQSRRPVWGALLGLVVPAATACWKREDVDGWAIETDLGCAELMSSLDLKAEVDGLTQMRREKLWNDCLGVSQRACCGVKGVMEYSTQALAHATGWEDFTPDEALLVGARVAVLQQLIAIRLGFTRADERDVVAQLLRAHRFAKVPAKTIQQHLDRMVDAYYASMGWDAKTGVPPLEALEQLGLAHLWQNSGVSNSKIPYAGSYSGRSAYDKNNGRFNTRKLKVTCPTCGRVFAALLSPYTKKMKGTGRSTRGEEARTNYQGNCRRCGSIFGFDVHTWSDETRIDRRGTQGRSNSA